ARGFVEKVTLDTSGFLEHGPEIFRLAPVQTVRLIQGRVALPVVANAPHLARVRGLDLRYLRLGDTAVCTLLGSLHLEPLTCLALTSNLITDRIVDFLANSHQKGDLIALHLGFNTIECTPAMMHLFCHTARLTTLDLSGNPLGDWGGRAMMVCSTP